MIRLVVKAIRHYLKKIAIDANLYDRGFVDYPHYERLSQERVILENAIDILTSQLPEKRALDKTNVRDIIDVLPQNDREVNDNESGYIQARLIY